MEAETLNIILINPDVKNLLLNLEELNLISIKNNNKMVFLDTVKRIRERAKDINLDEVMEDIESVRKEIYENENHN